MRFSKDLKIIAIIALFVQFNLHFFAQKVKKKLQDTLKYNLLQKS